jgi:uncharacterized protein YqfB (UPF0267 family)
MNNQDYLRIPYGMTNFADIRKDHYYFVDKTAYIAEIENANRFFFFIRPRRFGKTLLVSMLQHYYDVNLRDEFGVLFGDLYIGQHPTPEHNSFLIISLNFSKIDGGIGSYRESLDQHCETMFCSFCQRYKQLLPPDIQERMLKLNGGVAQLEFLSQCCAERGLKIYLFIDEYDHFTNTILSDDECLKRYEDETHREGYFRKFFNVIKAETTSSIKRCFITGVSPVTLDDLTSGFNIGTNYTTSASFNSMLGFSEDEVRAALDYYATKHEFHHTTDELIDWMKPWYDHYCFSQNSYGKESVFNSNMVLYFIDNYIRNEGQCPKVMIDANIRMDYSKLRMLVRKEKEFEQGTSNIQTIVSQGYITGNIKDHFPAHEIGGAENFVSLLFYFGLLTIGGIIEGEPKLIIPNQVVREQMYTYLLNAYREESLIQDDSQRLSLAKAMAYRCEWKPYFAYIAECLQRFASTRDKQKGEAFVHGFTLAMIGLSSYYRPESETDTHGGYADIFLSPLLEIYSDMKHSYVIEFKYAKQTDSAAHVEKLRTEAQSQLEKYMTSESIVRKKGSTQLHGIVIVYQGFIMKVCEEI